MADESAKEAAGELQNGEPEAMPEADAAAAVAPQSAQAQTFAKLAAAGGGTTLLAIIGGGYAFLDSHFEASRERDQRLEHRLTEFENGHRLEMQAMKHRLQLLERETSDSWTAGEMELWAARFSERLRLATVTPDGTLKFEAPSVREVNRGR